MVQVDLDQTVHEFQERRTILVFCKYCDNKITWFRLLDRYDNQFWELFGLTQKNILIKKEIDFFLFDTNIIQTNSKLGNSTTKFQTIRLIYDVPTHSSKHLTQQTS